MGTRSGVMLGLVLVFGLAGCAAIGVAKKDVDTGKQVLAEQGSSGSVEAHKLVDPILPFVPDPLKPFAGPLLSLLGVAITWNVGRRARKGQTPTAPFTGFAGQKVGIEFLLQQIVTVAVGAFRIFELAAAKSKAAVATVLPVKANE